MAQTVFEGLDEVRLAVGMELGTSDWLEITQERVNQFADATGDHQWIHVDVDRANAESPFGGPIAHGYLTLSLSNALLPEIVEVQGVSMGVNYGVGKVRFPAPVPVGAAVRLRAHVDAVDEVRDGVQLTVDFTVEVRGADKPAVAAQAVYRYYL